MDVPCCAGAIGSAAETFTGSCLVGGLACFLEGEWVDLSCLRVAAFLAGVVGVLKTPVSSLDLGDDNDLVWATSPSPWVAVLSVSACWKGRKWLSMRLCLSASYFQGFLSHTPFCLFPWGDTGPSVWAYIILCTFFFSWNRNVPTCITLFVQSTFQSGYFESGTPSYCNTLLGSHIQYLITDLDIINSNLIQHYKLELYPFQLIGRIKLSAFSN